jgi:hypothetical protein
MKTSLEEKLKISAFTGIVSIGLSMSPLSTTIGGFLGGQQSLVVGVMGFASSLGGMFIMDALNM